VIDKKILTTKDFSEFEIIFEYLSKTMSGMIANLALHTEAEESPIARIMKDLEDEGVTINIEDYGRDED
jgi:hypothetical protein